MARRGICKKHERGVQPKDPLFFDPECSTCVRLAAAEEAAGVLGPALRRNAPPPKGERALPYVNLAKLKKASAARMKFYAEMPEGR